MPGKNAGWTNGRWVPDSYCVDIRSNQLRSHIFQFSEMWCRQINWTTQLLPEGAETGERDVSYFICIQWVSVHVLNSEMVKMLIYTLKYARRYPKCGLFQPKMMKNNSHSVPGQGGGRLWPEKEAGKRGPPQIPHLVSWQSGPAWFWVPVARKGGWLKRASSNPSSCVMAVWPSLILGACGQKRRLVNRASSLPSSCVALPPPTSFWGGTFLRSYSAPGLWWPQGTSSCAQGWIAPNWGMKPPVPQGLSLLQWWLQCRWWWWGLHCRWWGWGLHWRQWWWWWGWGWQRWWQWQHFHSRAILNVFHHNDDDDDACKRWWFWLWQW